MDHLSRLYLSEISEELLFISGTIEPRAQTQMNRTLSNFSRFNELSETIRMSLQPPSKKEPEKTPAQQEAAKENLPLASRIPRRPPSPTAEALIARSRARLGSLSAQIPQKVEVRLNEGTAPYTIQPRTFGIHSSEPIHPILKPKANNETT